MMYTKIFYLLLLLNLSALAIPPELQNELDKRSDEKFDILCDFDFENTTYEKLSPKWIPIKGKYELVNGKLEGRELVEDKHVSTSGMFVLPSLGRVKLKLKENRVLRP